MKNFNIISGGKAIPIGNNLFLMKGKKHSEGGIKMDIKFKYGGNKGKNKNIDKIEVEDEEVYEPKYKGYRVFSDQEIFGENSPADLVLKGYNPDIVFAAQENWKKVHKINDDGTKKKKNGGESTIDENNEKEENNELDNYLRDVRSRQLYAESKYDINANNTKDALGMYQIRPIAIEEYNRLTGENLTHEDVLNPDIAIKVNNVLMNDIWNKQWASNEKNENDTVRMIKTLMGYNMGSGAALKTLNDLKSKGVNIYNVDDLLNNIPVKETRDYAKFIATGKSVGPFSYLNIPLYEIYKKMNSDLDEKARNGKDYNKETNKKEFGGNNLNSEKNNNMKTIKKKSFMDNLMQSISDLNQVRINNPAGLELRKEKDYYKRSSDARKYLIANAGGMTAGTMIPNEYLVAPSLLQPGIQLALAETIDKIFNNNKINNYTKKAFGGTINKYNNRKKFETGGQGQTTSTKHSVWGKNGKLYDTEEEAIQKGGGVATQEELDALALNNFKKEYWLINGLGAGLQGLTNIIGGTANYFANKDYYKQLQNQIDALKVHKQYASDVPVTKLKTEYNVNPQLGEVQNTNRQLIKHIYANAENSTHALNDITNALFSGRIEKNKLYGEKEKIETKLSNDDKLQQAATVQRNIENQQNVLNSNIAEQRRIQDLKYQGNVNLINQKADTKSKFINTIFDNIKGMFSTGLDAYNNFVNLKAGIGANPNSKAATFSSWLKR